MKKLILLIFLISSYALASYNPNMATSDDKLVQANYVYKAKSDGRLTKGVIYDDGTNIGIGTATAAAKLHVEEGNFLVTGTYGSGNGVPVQGAGTRAFFYPRKAAFRAGAVDTQWDENNIGVYSVAMGNSTKASGYASIAIGEGTNALDTFCIAMGYNLTASGWASTAIGHGLTAKSGYETVLGAYNTDYTPSSNVGWNATDRLFTIGNGTSDVARSNAMTVLKNGNVGIGTSTPSNSLHVRGAGLATAGAYNSIRLDNQLASSVGATNGISIWWNGMEAARIAAYMESLTSWPSALVFYTAPNASGVTEKMRITSSGNVGIGTTDPTSKLEVKSTSTTEPVFSVSTTTNTSALVVKYNSWPGKVLASFVPATIVNPAANTFISYGTSVVTLRAGQQVLITFAVSPYANANLTDVSVNLYRNSVEIASQFATGTYGFNFAFTYIDTIATADTYTYELKFAHSSSVSGALASSTRSDKKAFFQIVSLN